MKLEEAESKYRLTFNSSWFKKASKIDKKHDEELKKTVTHLKKNKLSDKRFSSRKYLDQLLYWKYRQF